jgi:L-Lysine epsilon oxidase N-terminal/L-lysine epsilon oxidase C-terminal domain
MKMATLQRVQIYPAIGIARIGNSPEWFLGPEQPDPAAPPTPPGDTYKDEQCRIKRQAQRFRLWGFYSDNTDRELTLADGDITWTVHLANAKPTITGEGIIDGGLQTLHGPGASVGFTGTFAGVSVPLGEAQLDSEGRLTVIGGFGKSENPTNPSDTPSFPNSPGWYDDVSDGPVTATITIGGQSHTAQNGAWVICPPPRFAPTTYAITTLYDTLRQMAITKGQLPAPGQPVFTTDVYPILQRALGMRWVTAFTFSSGDHDTLTVFAPPGGAGDTLANRQAVYARLRPAGNMPLLFDGENSSQLQDFQHGFMQQWSEGQVTGDWPPAVPAAITPDGLTRAALEACVGAPFYPGIEAGGIPQGMPLSKTILDLAFAEAFRLDQTQVGAGDLTRSMARPWQCDFMLCSGPTSQTAVDSDQSAWWPSARPISVYPFDDPTNKRLWTLGIASSPSEMVANWHQLGFIVDRGLDRPVETEKTNVCKNCFIITERNEISLGEAQGLRDTHEVIQDAFYVVVEGLAPSALGITSTSPLTPPLAAIAPSIAPAPPTGLTIVVNDVVFESSAALNQAQRITFGYNIGFTSTEAFTAEDVPVPITATIAGLSGSATIDLTKQLHPYMDHGPTSWLSTDTRVFQLQPGGTFAQQMLGNDPNGFVKAVIDSLRASPMADTWFDGLDPTEAGSQLEWSQTIGGQPVYNFAICRVRYRGEIIPAPNVRVFFRLFPAMTTSTDYQPTTTYRTGGQPGTKIPLLGLVGGEVTTIPFFADPRNPATMDLNLQTDTKNIFTIPANALGQEVHAYYGCWLDINQSGDKRFPIMPTPVDGGPFTGPAPLQSIADLIRGVHQCLVAEIAFDPDPIPTGATTANSDKLSQRNLAIDHSDNPGAVETHRVQHSFQIRPTAANLPANQHPSELMIRWNGTPRGSTGTLYLPGVAGAAVIDLADRLYSRHALKLADAHSIEMPVTGGVTYVPIPAGATQDLAGLLTVDLPSTVRAGQVFRIVIHQVVDGPGARPRLPPPPPRLRAAARRQPVGEAAVIERPATARHILGNFQFSVLVRTRPEILPPILRARDNLTRVLHTVPTEDRWHPVLVRYLAQVNGRIHALGGEPEPPPRPPEPPHHEPEATRRFEGKIAGLRFDRFGDFEGFTLDTEDGLRDFFSRERAVEELVNRAWRRRIAILIVAERHEHRHRPLSISLLRPPADE